MDERLVIHVDMDAFYAAVEQRDNPQYRGKPVIVGADPKKRGVVSTASYEARRYGVHSAMPIAEAFRLCPHGIYLRCDMAKYRRVSRQIHQVFARYTPEIEPISLDEAFLDVTKSARLFGGVQQIGREIQQAIQQELGLTASVGISYNKFLAKLASDLEKPKGFVVIEKEDIQKKVWPLPVRKLWGVGPKVEQTLLRIGLDTIGKVAAANCTTLEKTLGSMGPHLHRLANGIDNRPVEPYRDAKSAGKEVTFETDVADRERLLATLARLAESVGYRLRRERLKGYTVTLKLRDEDFKTFTRNSTLDNATNLDSIIYREAAQLLDKVYDGTKKVRLLGVTVSNLTRVQEEQMQIFMDHQEKEIRLTTAVDEIKSKFGHGSITRARVVSLPGKGPGGQQD